MASERSIVGKLLSTSCRDATLDDDALMRGTHASRELLTVGAAGAACMRGAAKEVTDFTVRAAGFVTWGSGSYSG